MTRYRPPAPSSSPYITPEGRDALEKELNFLWRVKRPQVTQAVSEAAAMGDRSENAEYIYGKKQLREIDRRVRFLRKRLEQLKVVDRPPDDPTRVFFGAWVRLEDEHGKEHVFRIVGADEFNPAKGWISIDSPLARALLKRAADDEFGLDVPGGRSRYVVLDVSYEPMDTAH
jgi:transcription elongation factor GreB